MNTTLTTSLPITQFTDADDHVCTHCGDAVEGETIEADRDGPEVFDPSDAVPDGQGYIHNKCIVPQIAESLDPSDRFEMVKLVHAMRIIANASTALLNKIDGSKLLPVMMLTAMRDEVVEQLNSIDPEECKTWDEPDLVFVKASALRQGSVIIYSAAADASIDLANARKNELPQYCIDIKADRLKFLSEVRHNLQEATA